jgi:hypothetical protein
MTEVRPMKTSILSATLVSSAIFTHSAQAIIMANPGFDQIFVSAPGQSAQATIFFENMGTTEDNTFNVFCSASSPDIQCENFCFGGLRPNMSCSVTVVYTPSGNYGKTASMELSGQGMTGFASSRVTGEASF